MLVIKKIHESFKRDEENSGRLYGRSVLKPGLDMKQAFDKDESDWEKMMKANYILDWKLKRKNGKCTQSEFEEATKEE